MAENETESENKNGQQPLPPSGFPASPNPPMPPRQNINDAAELKTARNLIMAGNILGPVSLLIGGVFASLAGLICGFIAHHKIVRLIEKQAGNTADVLAAKRSCAISLTICGVALILNAISLVMGVMMLMQMIESGDFASLVAQNMAGGSASGGAGSSTWG